MKKSTVYKHYFNLLIVSCLALLTAQCGGGSSSSPEIIDSDKITTQVTFKPENTPENKLIATETIPLNNCNGNSVLKMDVERSREFVYAIIDRNGYTFGGQYGFLTGLLEEEYSVVNGEQETQTHTLHLETKAETHIEYALVWKETWLNGEAVVRRSEEVKTIPYKVKKGLTLEVVGAKEIDCN